MARDLSEFMWHTLEHSMVVRVQEDDLEFILATFHWCQSPTTWSMIVSFQLFCPFPHFPDLLSKFVYSSFILSWWLPRLWLPLRTLPGMYLYLCPHLGLFSRTFSRILLDVADVHQCSNVDFPCLFVFVCLLCDLLSFLFHCCRCIWDQHCLDWKIFCSCFSVSRSMRLWETDSRIF